MIIGLLFSVGLYFITAIVGAIFNSTEIALITFVTIPAVMVISFAIQDLKIIQKETKSINKKNMYTEFYVVHLQGFVKGDLYVA